MMTMTVDENQDVRIPSKEIFLDGFLYVPEKVQGLVLFVHGSGSSRFSSRNQYVADYLNKAGLGTLLFDLLTPEEEKIDAYTGEFRFNIELLASRLMDVADWCCEQFTSFNMGYFGSSTGGGAALVAAAQKKENVKAVVSRGGRPDLAGEYLTRVETPSLMIVGGKDDVVIDLNKKAMQHMHCINKLEIVPGATHLFEEPGTLDEVARLAKDWFLKYLVVIP